MDKEGAENDAAAFSNAVKGDYEVEATTEPVVIETEETDTKELSAELTSTSDNASSGKQQEPAANATQGSNAENMEHQEGSSK